MAPCSAHACNLEEAVCKLQPPGSPRVLHCASISARHTSTVLAYPRWTSDTAIARGSVADIGPHTATREDRSSRPSCLHIEQPALLVPPVPSHAFHFFFEFAFHLFGALQAASPKRLELVLLPQPGNSSSSSGSSVVGRSSVGVDYMRRLRLDPFKARIYRALLGRARSVHHLGFHKGRQSICARRLTIGMAPDISLSASACYRLAHARALGACQLPSSTLLSDGFAPFRASGRGVGLDLVASSSHDDPLSRLRRLSNCTRTRHRLREFRSFVREQLAAVAPSAAPSATSIAGASLRGSASSGGVPSSSGGVPSPGGVPSSSGGVPSSSGGVPSSSGGGPSSPGGVPSPRRKGEPLTILFVQRELRGRRIVEMDALVTSVRDQLSGGSSSSKARTRGGKAVDDDALTTRRPVTRTLVADFGADQRRNARLLEDASVLVAAHGNALSNVLLAPPRGLRAVLQLMPSCLPNGTYSMRAYEVLGRALAGQSRSACCACVAPSRGKASDLRCNASEVAQALVGMLRS